MNADPVRISVALSREDRAEGLAYIEAFMRERFGCEPPETAGTILLARERGRIVGSMALESSDGSPFSLESRYSFEDSGLPASFVRKEAVQGMRWTAASAHVAEPLFRASCTLAYAFGKRHMIIEAKPSPVRRFRQMGIRFVPIPFAVLLPEEARKSVGDSGMRYFLVPPLPTVYTLEIEGALPEDA